MPLSRDKSYSAKHLFENKFDLQDNELLERGQIFRQMVLHKGLVMACFDTETKGNWEMTC